MCKKLMFLISFVTVLVLVNSGLAGDYLWEGNSPYSQLWVDPLNWNPPGGPGPSDTAKLEPGYPGDPPYVLVDNTVDKIQGPRRDENGDMTLEVVGGWFQMNRWEMVDGSDAGTGTINIGLSLGYGDPCVHINDGFRAFTDGDADGEGYLNIGGNSYVYINEDLEVFTSDDAEGYFEINIGDTATVEVSGMRLDDDTAEAECQLTVSGSATLNVFDGQLRHSDKATQRILITDDAYVYVDNTFRGADGGEGSDETHITGNAHLVANDGWESQDGTTLWTIDGNALVEVDGGDMYWRNGSLNIGGTATVLVEKDIQHDDKITVFNMYDCGPHVVCDGLGLPGDNDSTFATFNLHGGLIEIGSNGLYHDDDDWLLDICGCGVMVIDGNVVAEIWEDYFDGKITVCGFYLGCGAPYDLQVEYNHPDFPGDRTKVWVEHDPYQVHGPDPVCCTDPDAEDMPGDLCLSWTPGDSPCPPPITFYVFLSTDYDKVANGDLSAIVGITEVNELCVEDLCLGATYYWRVDAVCICYTAEGDVWCFDVEDCDVWDDMEAYDNTCDVNPIWETWLDGAGDCIGQGGNATGSAVFSTTDPDPLQDDKVMEYYYNSTGWEREYAYSEVNRIDPPENFLDNCQKALVLWFFGDPDNMTESMWVALSDGTNDGQVTYGTMGPDTAADIKKAEWQDFVMDLQDFADAGVDLENITEVSIGFGERGRDGEYPGDPMGIVYFDDISLCTTLCIPRYARDGDIDDDCDVDWDDVDLMVEDWLQDNCPTWP